MPRSRRDDDDDDDDEDRPRRKSRRDRDDDEDEDEEEDDRPRRKRSRSIADGDDDEDDRPRKRRKVNRSRKSAGGGGAMVLILLLIGGAVVLLVGGGFAVWFFVFNDTPEKAFADVKDAVLKKDYGRVYDRLDKEGQAEFENMRPNPLLKSTQSGKKGRELYIAILKDAEERAAALGVNRAEQERKYQDTKVESVTVDGDNATLTLRGSDGSTAPMKMVKQDGRWRVKTADQPAFRGR